MLAWLNRRRSQGCCSGLPCPIGPLFQGLFFNLFIQRWKLANTNFGEKLWCVNKKDGIKRNEIVLALPLQRQDFLVKACNTNQYFQPYWKHFQKCIAILFLICTCWEIPEIFKYLSKESVVMEFAAIPYFVTENIVAYKTYTEFCDPIGMWVQLLVLSRNLRISCE